MQNDIVVDDEPGAAEMFSEKVRVSGFQVLAASGCSMALKLIDNEAPSAVLLDIMLPGISGSEVLH